MSGKGSKQRPTNAQKYAENYDRIFARNTAAPLPLKPIPQAVEKLLHEISAKSKQRKI